MIAVPLPWVFYNEESEQLSILRQLPLLLSTSRLVILSRDFNCIIKADGRSGRADSELDAKSRFLMETVKVDKLHNVFSIPANRVQRRYTWSQPDRSIHSRIDFLFAFHMFMVRSTNVKPVFFSDHCLLLSDCHLQDDLFKSVCDLFELASGAKVKRGESKTVFLGTGLTDPLSPSPLGRLPEDAGNMVWRAGECAKSCEERVVKVKQEPLFWEHHSFSIAGKKLAISSMKQDSVLYGLCPGTHTKIIIDSTWMTINSVKDALWSAQNLLVFQNKELTLTECCRLVHSK
eukprot:g39919.t1